MTKTKKIMDKEMFYLLVLKNELDKMNLSVDDIEEINIGENNISIKLKGAIKHSAITLEIKND